MSLLTELRSNYPVISVFSGSEADNPFYSYVIPKVFIQAKVSKRGLKQVINRQKLAIAHDSPLKDALLILDDCFDHPDRCPPPGEGGGHWHRGARQRHDAHPLQARASFACLRVVRTTPRSCPPWEGTIGTQYVVDLKPWARSTTSAIFLFHCPNARDRKLLYENYGCGAFPDYASFNHVYTWPERLLADREAPRWHITSTPHTAMVILLNQGTQGLLQSVFWYRPTLPTAEQRVRLCHPKVWEHASQRTDPNKLDHLALLSCCSADEEGGRRR